MTKRKVKRKIEELENATNDHGSPIAFLVSHEGGCRDTITGDVYNTPADCETGLVVDLTGESHD